MATTPCPEECTIPVDVTGIINLCSAMATLIETSFKEDLSTGRINGHDYATMKAAVLSQIANSSMQSVISLQNKETAADKAVKEAQVDVSVADIALREAQADVSIRQKEGFDDSLRQKAFDSQMNSWAMMFSSGLLESVPCFISGDEATSLYKGIIEKTMPDVSDVGTTTYEKACCEAGGGTWDPTKNTCTPASD